jgi:GMP synthase (glutamine-hydrolysing)
MITIWQHGEDEAAGEIEEYLKEIQEPFEILRLHETQKIPKTLPSHLIILGGQMSVNDTLGFPYFFDEQKVIREMVSAARPVLGICLGAQMIAASFGKPVYRSAPERGWCGTTGCDLEWRVIFPEKFTVFHWHNETFNLPDGATLLSRGDTVENQAFKMGSAVGVQFHPEVTVPILSQWTESSGNKDRIAILKETECHLDQSRERCRDLVNAFVRCWK